MVHGAEGYWWLSANRDRRQSMQAIIAVPAVAVCLAGLEGRLVFPAFGEYIRLHPPFNYIAVTAALYGIAFLILLHAAGDPHTAAAAAAAAAFTVHNAHAAIPC